jgi:hypothetical protein
LNFRHYPLLFYRPAFPIAKVLGQGAADRHFALSLGFGGQPGRGSLLSRSRAHRTPVVVSQRPSEPPKLPNYITNENMLNDARTNSRMRELSIFRCHDASRFHE